MMELFCFVSFKAKLYIVIPTSLLPWLKYMYYRLVEEQDHKYNVLLLFKVWIWLLQDIFFYWHVYVHVSDQQN